MKRMDELKIDGKRVLCRVDFNVPLDDEGKITDDSRITGALPTIRKAVDKKAKVILMSHMGRPDGKPDDKFSLSPVAERLEKLLEKKVKLAPDCIGEDVKKMVSEMNAGDVLLLENLRFHPGEKKNSDDFAKELAALCDVYINDAFAVCHRAHASVSAITKHVSEAGAGLLLQKELDYFEKAMADPKRPLVAIIGGAKVSSKLKALENMLSHVNKIIIGGAMANTFLKKKGISVGSSKVEDDLLDSAGSVMEKAEKAGIDFYLPTDFVVAQKMEKSAETKTVSAQEIPDGWMALDIGPETTKEYDKALADAKTIIWNGPMGVFEMEPFSRGTLSLVKTVANADALSIVGGGDTDTAVHMSGQADKIDFISTGGGAFLTLMEGKPLPGVAALDGVGKG